MATHRRIASWSRRWLAPAIVGIALAATALAGPRPAAAAVPEDPASREAKALYVEGVKHYNLGHYDDAIKAFEAGYLKRPDASFLFNLGQCYRMKHDPEQEVQKYRAYLRAAPEAPNRAAVEGFIKTAEEELRQKAAAEAAAAGKPSIEPRADGQGRSAAIPPAEAPGARATPTPLYKRWWLWTLVGGVVAVGAGVGVGVALATSSTSKGDFFPAVTF